MSPNPSHVLVVSDLHLSEGLLPHEGKYSPLEDFVSDQAFADFLAYHQQEREQTKAPPWQLIIAGDLFDFLQITAVSTPNAAQLQATLQSLPPAPPSQLTPLTTNRYVILERWLNQLEAELHDQTLQACVQALKAQLQQPDLSAATLWQLERFTMETWILANQPNHTLTKNQKKYGLGTSWQETVWKLQRIAEGHPLFFRALSTFLNDGNKLLIMLGNHDIELIWPEVQTYLRNLLLEADGAETITFEPWYHHEPGRFYIEHGNQYEGANAFGSMANPRLPKQETLISLPAGSLLVRYLFNKIEAAYPYADNIHPITRFFSWAIKNKLFTLIAIMLRYLWPFLNFMWQFLWKLRSKEAVLDDSNLFEQKVDAAAREIRKSLFSRLQTAVILILVAILIAIIFIPPIYSLFRLAQDPTRPNLLWSIAASLFSLFFNQVIAPWLLRYIAGDGYLEEAAQAINQILSEANQAAPYIIFGHNHTPDIIHYQTADPPFWYINTGSWLYREGDEENWLQQENYYTFLKITPDQPTSYPQLLRWNPIGKRPFELRLRMKS